MMEEKPNFQNDENINAQNIGLYGSSAITVYQIMDGFYLQDENILFLTFDVVTNNIMIELFKFNKMQLKPKLRQKLCSREKYDSWNAVINP